MAEKTLLAFDQITKTFPGVKALDSVSIEFEKGEVHALVGENGAGKSTLMKILSGVYSPDSGRILIDGSPVTLKDPEHAQMMGISIIFQEFSLIGSMSVAENVYLNREPVTRLGFMDRRRQREDVLALEKLLDIELDPDALVSGLSVVQQQLVEIMKALSVDARILIMDEPSAPLTDKELAKLFSIIESLRKKGVTIIYISHMLEEIFQIADRVTVIKDGRGMGTYQVSDMDKDSLVSLMVGRDIRDIYPRLSDTISDAVMEVKGLSTGKVLTEVDFTLRSGEILGLAGMVGCGRSVLLEALLGLRDKEGTISIDGQPVEITSMSQAIAHGLCYIPSDRKQEGIIPHMNITVNTTVTSLEAFLHSGVIDRKAETQAARAQTEALRTKTPSLHSLIENLSGGNQQKVLISRALLAGPRIYLIAEPTRGIDVGAKHEIYQIMRDLTEKGCSIIMLSSELPEVLGMSDRILVLHKGRVAGIIDQHERPSSEEEILSLAVGHQYTLSAGKE